jgi:hypothetical protein
VDPVGLHPPLSELKKKKLVSNFASYGIGSSGITAQFDFSLREDQIDCSNKISFLIFKQFRFSSIHIYLRAKFTAQSKHE